MTIRPKTMRQLRRPNSSSLYINIPDTSTESHPVIAWRRIFRWPLPFSWNKTNCNAHKPAVYWITLIEQSTIYVQVYLIFSNHMTALCSVSCSSTSVYAVHSLVCYAPHLGSLFGFVHTESSMLTGKLSAIGYFNVLNPVPEITKFTLEASYWLFN